MSIKVINPFDTSENYIIDSGIEITGGVAKLVPQVSGAEAELYVKLDDNDTLVAIDSSGNNRHGAFQGGFTENQWTTGKINSAIQGLSSTNGFINFDQLIEFEYNEPFSLEFWINFTSSSAQSFITKQKNDSPFTGFAVTLQLNKIRFVIRDTVGNVLAIDTVNTYNDAAWHHVVATWDGSNVVGGMDIFVDNVSNNVIAVSAPLTTTIKNNVNLQISGREGNNNCLDSNTKIDEVLIYSRKLTAAEVSFRWNGGAGTQQIPGASTTFPTNNPAGTPKSNILATELISFFADIAATGLDEIRFALLVNNAAIYWDGSNWTDSTGYDQTNTAAEILANLATLDLGDGQPINYKFYLHSADGGTTPELLEVEFDFNYFTADIEKPSECLVYGKIFDENNLPIEGVTISIQPSCSVARYNGTSIVSFETKSTTTNSNGYWEVSLIETSEMDIAYFFAFIDGDNIKTFKRSVPNRVSENFSNLTEY